MARSRSAIDWLIRPWMEPRGSALRRAGRVYLVVGALSAAILPAMVLRFGADGWLWHLTASVLFFAPIGIVAVDNAAERVDRPRAPRAGAGPRRRLGGLVRVALLFVGMALGIIAGYAAPFAFPALPMPGLAVLVRDFERNMTIVSVVVAAGSAVAALSWYRAEAFRLESAVATASFAALKSQLQPHFLFNALNSLKELIDEDPAQASAMTQRIADLYRLILRASTEATLPLRDELAIVESYLEVERMRYGDRLRFRIDAAPELGGLHVPSLMVQALVENAVKHGICKAREGGEVRVRAQGRADGALDLEVTNTGAPYAPAAARRAGGAPPTGLANTAARLALMYGDDGELRIDSDPILGTRVRLVVTGERVGQGA